MSSSGQSINRPDVNKPTDGHEHYAIAHKIDKLQQLVVNVHVHLNKLLADLEEVQSVDTALAARMDELETSSNDRFDQLIHLINNLNLNQTVDQPNDWISREQYENGMQEMNTALMQQIDQMNLKIGKFENETKWRSESNVLTQDAAAQTSTNKKIRSASAESLHTLKDEPEVPENILQLEELSDEMMTPTDIEHNKARVDELCDKLETSEREYCALLLRIIDGFIRPLKHQNLIEESEIELMFPSTITELYESHCILLHQIQNRMTRPCERSQMTDIFLARIQKQPGEGLLDKYTEYWRLFAESNELIEMYFSPDNPQSSVILSSLPVTNNSKGKPQTASLKLIKKLLLQPLHRLSSYLTIFKELHAISNSDKKANCELSAIVTLLGNAMQSDKHHSTNTIDAQKPVKPKRKKKRAPVATYTDAVTSESQGEDDILHKQPYSHTTANKVYHKRMQRSTGRKLTCPSGAAAVILRNNQATTAPEHDSEEDDYSADVIDDAESEDLEVENLKLDVLIVDRAHSHSNTPVDPEPPINATVHPKSTAVTGMEIEDKDETVPAVRPHSTDLSELLEGEGSTLQRPTSLSIRKSPVSIRDKANKSVHSVKQSVAAFFSRRKNEQRFGSHRQDRSKSQSGDRTRYNTMPGQRHSPRDYGNNSKRRSLTQFFA